MSEGSAEGGGSALSTGQFGEVTQTGDLPPFTAQNPGTGIFALGFGRNYTREDLPKPRRRKKRKRSR